MNSEMESWKLQVSKSEDPAPGSILPATDFVCVGQSLSHSLLMFLILENLSEPMIFFHIQGHYMDKWSESIMLVLYVLVIFIKSKFLFYQMKWISLSRYILLFVYWKQRPGDHQEEFKTTESFYTVHSWNQQFFRTSLTYVFYNRLCSHFPL